MNAGISAAQQERGPGYLANQLSQLEELCVQLSNRCHDFEQLYSRIMDPRPLPAPTSQPSGINKNVESSAPTLEMRLVRLNGRLTSVHEEFLVLRNRLADAV